MTDDTDKTVFDEAYDRTCDRAFELLTTPQARRFFWALDVLGWKVVKHDTATSDDGFPVQSPRCAST
jgi:hypothetical protein